jgi:hypothetical protein
MTRSNPNQTSNRSALLMFALCQYRKSATSEAYGDEE